MKKENLKFLRKHDPNKVHKRYQRQRDDIDKHERWKKYELYALDGSILFILLASISNIHFVLGYDLPALFTATGMEFIVALCIRSLAGTSARKASTTKEWIGLSMFSILSFIANTIHAYTVLIAIKTGQELSPDILVTWDIILNSDIIQHVTVIAFSGFRPAMIIIASLVKEQMTKNITHEIEHRQKEVDNREIKDLKRIKQSMDTTKQITGIQFK